MNNKYTAEKIEYFKTVLNEIARHKDYGERNPVDIGIECGYSEEELKELVQWVQEEQDEVVKGELSNVTISDSIIIKKKEKKVFENQIIHINAMITVEDGGTLEFHNCVVYYGEELEPGGITLISRRSEWERKDARLVFEGCKIICRGYIPELWGEWGGSFIQGIGSYITFTNCHFEDCGKFLEVRVWDDVTISNCRMINCISFAKLNLEKSATGQMSDCIIIEHAISKMNLLGLVMQGREMVVVPILIYIDGFTEKMEIENNMVMVAEDFTMGKFYGENIGYKVFSAGEIGGSLAIKGCTFINASNCIEAGVTDIRKCFFKRCNVAICSGMQGNIIDSYFESTKLFYASGRMNTMKNCQFIDGCDYGYPSLTDCIELPKADEKWLERKKGEGKQVGASFDMETVNRYLKKAEV